MQSNRARRPRSSLAGGAGASLAAGLALALGLGLAGCALEDDIGPGEAGEGEATGTASRPIVNGALTSDFPSTGVLLAGASPESASIRCSGTLIGCDTFLTAAHCVCDTVGGDCQAAAPDEPLHVFFQHGGFRRVTARSVHPSYSFPDADVAVLTLEAPVSGIAPTPLADSAPALGTTGTIVGFGRTGGDNYEYGVKYAGPVVTASCPGDIDATDKVCWDFGGTGSNTCNGDSGGPLFFEGPSGLQVGGITSGGTRFDCLAGDQSYDVSVFSHRDFIAARAGGELAASGCGPLPRVGEALVAVTSDAGALSAGESAELLVEVPPGTTELRVGLNSSDGSGANVDLEVSRAGDAAPACDGSAPGAYAFCQLPAPEPDTYRVQVTAAAGAGEYQVTATVIGGGPIGADDSYQTVAGQALEQDAAGGVLANDEAPLGGLTAALTTPPAGGTVELAPDGSFVYTAGPGFLGEDSFSYEATDGTYATSAVVTVIVAEAGEGGEGSGVLGGCAASGGGRGGRGAPALLLLGLAALLVRRRRG